MHLHILGIGGTFMSALALLARDAGFEVTGSDANCYPPISDLLTAKGIVWTEGYEDTTQALKADCVIVGNAIKRGMPVIEAVLNAKKPYTSGPQWLAENILPRYRVMAVSGTHGKTTTTSMLAFILHEAGLKPGFLIGGMVPFFNSNACLGEGAWFVIEADEYDSAFFDKRPKLMHYRPEVAILTNLEFDHADIYDNLAAIEQQFFYYLKTIPSQGTVIAARDDANLKTVMARGVFSKVEDTALSGEAVWRAELQDDSGSSFLIWHRNKLVAEINWPLIGHFNVENALSALAASTHAGVDPAEAAESLMRFQPVKRRLEVRAKVAGVTVYDDFAHHPTAIAKTTEALRQSKRHKRILLVLEFASYTMRSGVHATRMAEALKHVDLALMLAPEFDLGHSVQELSCPYAILPSTDAIIARVGQEAKEGDAILVMSNRGFDNIHQRIIQALSAQAEV